MHSQHQDNLLVGKPFVEIMFNNISFSSTGKFFITVFVFIQAIASSSSEEAMRGTFLFVF